MSGTCLNERTFCSLEVLECADPKSYRNQKFYSFLLVKSQDLLNQETHFSSVSFNMDTGVEEELPTSIDERTMLIPKIRSRRVICATLISIWGTFSFGYSLGYSSPASYDLQSNTSASVDVHLDSSQQSWFSVSVRMNELKGV